MGCFVRSGNTCRSVFSARRQGKLRFKRPIRSDLLNPFLGGLGLGVGASLAVGCSVGHGLTGLAFLAPGSFVAMASIFAGSVLVAGLVQRKGSGPVPCDDALG